MKNNDEKNIIKELTCYYCGAKDNCELTEGITKETISGFEIEYLEKYYKCPNCGGKIEDDMYDFNVSSANDALREKTGLIRTKEIEEILNKYAISQKNLSNILGFGEIQISRYLKSGNPNKEHSDILKSIKDTPFLFEGYLLNSKDLLEDKAFKKSLGKVRQLEMIDEHSKIYNVGLFIIKNCEDITNLSLQKVLYFIEGFSKKLLGYKLFNESAQAWRFGPVYTKMYDAFSYFVGAPIEKSEVLNDKEFDLTPEEKEYILNISKYFTCYSGAILRDMSHLTDPWISARKGLNPDEPSNRVISEGEIDEYFDKIIKKYNINDYDDVKKYSEMLFNETLEN